MLTKVEPFAATRRPVAMRAFLRPAMLAALAVVAAACGGATGSASPIASSPPSGGPSAEPSSAPSGSPSASPTTVGAIEHSTSPTAIVLRYDVGGGLIAAGFSASQTPIFTLYGDGTIVFKNILAAPPPTVGSTTPNVPLRTARLSEDQIQQLLTLALGQAGLGTARTEYQNPLIADAPSTTFTIDAGGVRKTVNIMALGMDTPGVPDGPARVGFNLLAQKLGDFDQGGSIRTDEYAPEHYRGILLEGFAGDAPPTSWPWTDLKPADFVFKGDPNSFPTPARVLTPTQVEALGVTPFTGGFQNLVVQGPDAKLYAVAIRPLLPDESE